MARILVIDSYDSFVYNIVQYLGELGADPVVVRNDAITVAEAAVRANAVPMHRQALRIEKRFSGLFSSVSMEVSELLCQSL